MSTRGPRRRARWRRTVRPVISERCAPRRGLIDFGRPGVANSLPRMARWPLRLSAVWIILVQTVFPSASLSGDDIALLIVLLAVTIAGWCWVLFGRGGWVKDQAALVVAIGAC